MNYNDHEKCSKSIFRKAWLSKWKWCQNATKIETGQIAEEDNYANSTTHSSGRLGIRRTRDIRAEHTNVLNQEFHLNPVPIRDQRRRLGDRGQRMNRRTDRRSPGGATSSHQTATGEPDACADMRRGHILLSSEVSMGIAPASILQETYNSKFTRFMHSILWMCAAPRQHIQHHSSFILHA